MKNTKKITVSLDDDLLKWIDEKIDQRIFAGRSHAIQVCVSNEKKRDLGKSE